jgi:hypothetical protein
MVVHLSLQLGFQGLISTDGAEHQTPSLSRPPTSALGGAHTIQAVGYRAITTLWRAFRCTDAINVAEATFPPSQRSALACATSPPSSTGCRWFNAKDMHQRAFASLKVLLQLTHRRVASTWQLGELC